MPCSALDAAADRTAEASGTRSVVRTPAGAAGLPQGRRHPAHLILELARSLGLVEPRQCLDSGIERLQVAVARGERALEPRHELLIIRKRGKERVVRSSHVPAGMTPVDGVSRKALEFGALALPHLLGRDATAVKRLEPRPGFGEQPGELPLTLPRVQEFCEIVRTTGGREPASHAFA